MAKLLYVVHRYAPYPGGSENYVRDMAEETLSRGHEVWVLSGEHQGDLNGVKVTSDASILNDAWDLIVVHGGDVTVQNYVLSHAVRITSPILYQLILPSESPTCLKALQDCKYLGCSTTADWKHIRKHNILRKGVAVRHGIDEKISVGMQGFREKYGIKTKNMFLSCGGYWPNKAMHELVEVFNNAQVPDTTLVLTGYDNRHGLMPNESEFVKPFLIDSRADVMSAIREADLYILHSHSEGFGLVLLESMLNKTQWVARNIAGAETMKDFGMVYDTDEQLVNILKTFKSDKELIDKSYEYVTLNRLIGNTVDDILRCI